MSGTYLRLAREALGLSIEQLSQRIPGTSPSIIRQYERDIEPSINDSYAIADVRGVNAASG